MESERKEIWLDYLRHFVLNDFSIGKEAKAKSLNKIFNISKKDLFLMEKEIGKIDRLNQGIICSISKIKLFQLKS